MAVAEVHADPHHLGALADVAHEGPAPKRIVTGYGFWIFLLSDMVMFSCFFAAYAVLLGQTAGGPSGAELFNLKSVAVETACLLLSTGTPRRESLETLAPETVRWRRGAARATRRDRLPPASA